MAIYMKIYERHNAAQNSTLQHTDSAQVDSYVKHVMRPLWIAVQDGSPEEPYEYPIKFFNVL